MNRKGFTLSEVLITLGIIGVVAAMTLPVLQQKIQQEIYKNRWKKAYAEINQAYLMVQAQEDLSPYWNCTEVRCFNPVVSKILAQYKKIQKVTSTENNGVTENWAKKLKYKSILGKEFTVFPTLHYAGSMNDMTIFYWSYYHKGAAIWVDINGYNKNPNVLGKDMFALEIKQNKIYPFGQFATGDWCHGAEGSLGVTYLQGGNANDPIDPDDPSFTGDGVINSLNYAGLGCSYEYLYGKKQYN